MPQQEPGSSKVSTQVNDAESTYLSSAVRYIKILPKAPVRGRVGVHDHRRLIIVGLGEELKLLFNNGKFTALVEDPDRNISYVTNARVGDNRMFIYIPKKLWPLYNRGETVRVLVTPLAYLTRGDNP